MEKITSDMKLIKVLASEARREDVPEDQVQERVYLMKEEKGKTKDSPYVMSSKLRNSKCNQHGS